ncbi:MAG: M56 family metallopeptidase [Fimbriimonas sp.]|nr:M56 family metallopeptidase [Fimbriimonas sp.]
MNGSWVGSANEVGASMIDAVWRASWQGAVGIAIVWLVCRAWKRMPISVRCALWFLVCLKLIVALSPAGITVPLLPSETRIPAKVTPAEGPVVSVTPMAIGSFRAETSRFVAEAPTKESLRATAWLAGIWMLGFVLVGAYSLGQLGKSLRLIRQASPCTDRTLLEQAKALRLSFGLHAMPRILMTREPALVLTFAAPHPVILISARTLENCTEDEMRMILAHEFAHIRRRDAWLGLIPQLAQSLFFFHPLVWLACREFDFAREAACDAEAISCLQIGADHYGRLLLKLGSRRQTATTLCTPGVSSHFHLLRRRIAMLDKPIEATIRRTQRRSLALTCLIGALCIAPLSLVQGQHANLASLKTYPSASTRVKKSAKSAAGLSKASAKHVPTIIVKQIPIDSKPSLHVFRLKNADADKAAEVLHQVLSSGSGRVAADAKSNSIIVNADEATTAQIAAVIKNLDEMDRADTRAPSIPREPQEVKVYRIRYANTDSLFQILHNLYGNPALAVVKVAEDSRTNSIIVTAPENRTKEVSELITNLDVPTPIDPPEKAKIIRVIRVQNGDPRQIVSAVKAILKNEAPDYLAPDLQNHDILIRATDEECMRVQVLVNILDIPRK